MSVPSTFDSIWVEKYRPKYLHDVEGSDAVLGRLRSMIKDGNMQHILVAGPPGTGKTTSVMCMARELLGEENISDCVKELNASDDRGVDVVRRTIKEFARKSVVGTLPVGRHKIVILDEVDSMTSAAQQALRRIMEIYSKTTRFALICNNSTKVIEPIQSRCVIVRFSKLTEEKIMARLLKVCIAEKLQYDDEGLKTIVFTADGDLRSALNNLQSTAQGFEKCITNETVLKICDIPSPEVVNAILNDCLNLEWRSARNRTLELVEEGYTGSDVIAVLKSLVKKHKKMSEETQLQALIQLTTAAPLLADGNNSFLQLDCVLMNLCKIAGESR